MTIKKKLEGAFRLLYKEDTYTFLIVSDVNSVIHYLVRLGYFLEGIEGCGDYIDMITISVLIKV